jgi:hypothetical protein
MQGDLLLWLLSPALAHDAAAAAATLRRARQRDRVLVDAFELRERALALARHRPCVFTLEAAGHGSGWRAVWDAAVERVEQVGLKEGGVYRWGEVDGRPVQPLLPPRRT